MCASRLVLDNVCTRLPRLQPSPLPLPLLSRQHRAQPERDQRRGKDRERSGNNSRRVARYVLQRLRGVVAAGGVWVPPSLRAARPSARRRRQRGQGRGKEEKRQTRRKGRRTHSLCADRSLCSLCVCVCVCALQGRHGGSRLQAARLSPRGAAAAGRERGKRERRREEERDERREGKGFSCSPPFLLAAASSSSPCSYILRRPRLLF